MCSDLNFVFGELFLEIQLVLLFCQYRYIPVSYTHLDVYKRQVRAWYSPKLSVRRQADGVEIITIPLINYLLILKSDLYASMDSQEFLDRESEWSMISSGNLCIYYCFKERFLCGKGGEKIGEIFCQYGILHKFEKHEIIQRVLFFDV